MNTKIKFIGSIVEFYTYRRAIVPPQFSIQGSDLWEEVKDYVEANGYRMDNHIAFKTSNGLYFGYSDHTLYISTNINKGNW